MAGPNSRLLKFLVSYCNVRFLPRFIEAIRAIPKKIVRAIVRKLEKLKYVWRSLSVASLSYCTYKCWYLFIVKKSRYNVKDAETIAGLAVASISSVTIIFGLGYFVYHRIKNVQKYFYDRRELGGFYTNFPPCFRNFVSFLTISTFPIVSTVLGSYIGNDGVALEIIWSLVIFVLSTSLAMWKTGDFGISDAFIAIILGKLMNAKKSDKYWFMCLTTAIPATKKIFVPLGNYLKEWASSSTDANDVGPTVLTGVPRSSSEPSVSGVSMDGGGLGASHSSSLDSFHSSISLRRPYDDGEV